eukprot:CAMPEP_0175010190 /NCGR_PEP_ID=MMETSP0005-20121125/7963_1 /TAXON_ID=420556 /ORGANISM="Ochromonas sp., Strain CCMP1393" /LENGTH=56 /DNA_ID=CAMNT_0016265983 /DNA_START=410 /DNA_END=576 /DNA_ORIENTATION=-
MELSLNLQGFAFNVINDPSYGYHEHVDGNNDPSYGYHEHVDGNNDPSYGYHEHVDG